MLNIDTIKNGLVIDHIKAGTGWRIFQWLGLDTSPFSAALIMNVVSRKSGKKDIIKIENVMDIDYSVLGFIDPEICTKNNDGTSRQSSGRFSLQKSSVHNPNGTLCLFHIPAGRKNQRNLQMRILRHTLQSGRK